MFFAPNTRCFGNRLSAFAQQWISSKWAQLWHVTLNNLDLDVVKPVVFSPSLLFPVFISPQYSACPRPVSGLHPVPLSPFPPFPIPISCLVLLQSSHLLHVSVRQLPPLLPGAKGRNGGSSSNMGAGFATWEPSSWPSLSWTVHSQAGLCWASSASDWDILLLDFSGTLADWYWIISNKPSQILSPVPRYKALYQNFDRTANKTVIRFISVLLWA